jgi:DNA topoisomerase-3
VDTADPETNETQSTSFGWHRHRLFDKLACTIIYEMCIENPTATVVNVESKETKKYRPFPLTTVALQMVIFIASIANASKAGI